MPFDKIPARVAGGTNLELRNMGSCDIAFLTDENTYITEKISQVKIMDRQNPRMAAYLPQYSLLGIDVLARFKFSFDDTHMYMEK